MTVNELRDLNKVELDFKISPATWCEVLNDMGVTKFEKLIDGYMIIQNGLYTRITVEEEKSNDEKKTS